METLKIPDSPDRTAPSYTENAPPPAVTAKTRQETALRALIAAGEAHDDIPDDQKLVCAPPVPADCVGTPIYEGSCCGFPEV